MSESRKPLSPVKPSGMEIIFMFTCPFCGRDVPYISPTQPAMAQCDACRRKFPIVPVDEKVIRFYKTMLANGHAAIDPDFL
ncbi:hypothetical protein [Maridesulfovibrio hydrothermalis]|uniref:hypothetical protein n=1 Tax=Maridesulfovibrio hydrothermalis TaxID=191026 RepID=UPI0004841980|nr:hypothetical protein [Maridesulfovibrio hydrothermalis]